MKSVLLLAACLLFVSSNGQGYGNPWQGPGSSVSLVAGRPYPAGVSAGPVGCGQRVGLGCVKSIVLDLNCAHGTYVDSCNMCKCMQGPIRKTSLYINAQRNVYSLQRLGTSLSLVAGRPYPAGVSAGPVGCGQRVGLGCVKSIVVDLNCAHGTYVDSCNMCKCTKGPIEKIPLYVSAQGPGSSLSLVAGRPYPAGVSAGPVGCGQRVGLGCVKSIVVDLNCAHGTYVDSCNMCQCMQGPIGKTSLYITAQRNMYSLQRLGTSLSLVAGRPYPAGVSAGPVGCGQRVGLGCVKSIVVDLNCAHGTYVDSCNMCKCTKGPIEKIPLYVSAQGPGSSLSLVAGRPYPAGVSAGPVGCGQRVGLGCVKSIVLDLNCAHGTYVDRCNMCKCMQRPFHPGVSAGPSRCGRRPGQGCVQSVVADMKCAHGTYVDRCNMCQCAKGPNEICGGARGEHGRCTTKLHCFKENVSHFVGKCGTHIDG
ncbi:uncharacterized protein LOC122261975 isoform X4 [Penaeus japonicus]|uniref:uncharacterized protein LOC122261975 isoform X3 n=1 Tax=Penaeus japonicus TaxID=27405 RepID=UPI001C713BD5|nr:uncharacterized protein LOC122261975 isoform X3 [Penaeus japonicus]XP_042885784.1 uncharacterized protein LOC122261975 isoform X4 [Penaeus japonicus]